MFYKFVESSYSVNHFSLNLPFQIILLLYWGYIVTFIKVLFLTLLLAYISCTGVFSLWYFHMCLQCTLIRYTVYIIVSHCLCPHLKTISSSFIVLFSCMYTKCINYTHDPYLLSLFTLPLPLVFISDQDLFHVPILHFLIAY
jgi:hypothetical protein